MTSSKKTFKNDTEYYADTTHISSSMIGAYLKSPAYYEALYIKKSISRPYTTALQFGSAVDMILTEGWEKFYEVYSPQVYKKDDAEQYELNRDKPAEFVLTQSMWKSVVLIAKKVESTEAYKWLKKNKANMQCTLTGEYNGAKIKGKLDFLTITDRKAYIDDLKTTTNVHPVKYYYHCLDYNYFVQAAMYRLLVTQNYDVTEVVNRHLVVTKDSAWPEVKTFKFLKSEVDKAMDKIDYAVHGITNKLFSDPKCGWDDSMDLGKKEEEFIIRDI